MNSQVAAAKAIKRCRELAGITETPGQTLRTFLSPAMRECMQVVGSWMAAAGMSAVIDAAGNLRGLYPGTQAHAPRLLIGSHLDTVPNAGAFDGVLGVMLGLALVESLEGRALPFAIEVVAFSEEEGVRYRIPFLGSRALVGTVDRELLCAQDERGVSVREAIEAFGLNPAGLSSPLLDANARGYLEFHIEQGPVLESEGLSLGVVDRIAGQTRGDITFSGSSNHAGTTPMHLRKDAMVAAAQWICEVERIALSIQDLVATVGRLTVHPGAGNVIAGGAQASLDVRHPEDAIRRMAVEELVGRANSIAVSRGLQAKWHMHTETSAVRMNTRLSHLAFEAVCKTGSRPLRMTSGAGHDAMILAERLPSAMIFLRSPGGISHHPEETVHAEDVANALEAGMRFLDEFEKDLAGTEEDMHA
ncbi:MAG TPA: allantoate amidohydrolase [Acidobacteriaceae bacterium]|nr:allantoate amidohydrolase [Acidobacteriaceae bacterium]